MPDEKELSQLRNAVSEETARFESSQPQPSDDIDIVWSFSGPGTLLSPLKGYEEPWMAWMEANRLQRAILLIYEVTALRLEKPVPRVTREEIATDGPFLLYNGIPIEMEAFLEVSSLRHFPIPEEKIVTVDGVTHAGEETKPIGNTRDQVLSYPRSRFEELTPRAVALVSSAAHLPRVLRYIDLIRPFPPETKVRCFPLHSDPSWAAIDAVRETERIVSYYLAGHLSANPYPTDLGLG